MGGAQAGITAQSPQPKALPSASEVQPGMPPASARARTTAYADDTPDSVALGSEFRPGGGLALAVKTLLGLNLLLSAALLGSEYLQYNLATRLVARAAVPDAEIESNDARQMAIGIAHFLVFVVSAIVFVVWFYRAHANLAALGARELTYTSGWAAGCWFVPILNLFRPVQIAQEIWRNSDPDAVRGKYIHVETSASSGLIGLWWAASITSNIISNISMRMSWAVTSPESLQSATAAGMAAEVASIIAALLTLAVVSTIDARQTARAEALRVKARSTWENEV
jgi:hypothetical protein